MPAQENYLSLGLYFIAVIAVVLAMLASYFLGPLTLSKAKSLPYESGILNPASLPQSFPVQYYLIAMFFVIFDLESVFLVAWASSVQSLGVFGLVQALIFIGFLLIAFIYIWRTGGFDLALCPRKNKKGQVQ